MQLDGFGTGAFDWTTADAKNSYIDTSGLHIVPTLTNETTGITSDQLYANYTLDLLKDGTCTSQQNSSCVTRSDPKKGVMIPPVRSARLSTKGKKSIRYGKVEVVAKMPKGDWIWPAICESSAFPSPQILPEVFFPCSVTPRLTMRPFRDDA